MISRCNLISLYTELNIYWASLVAQRVKSLPAMWETWVQSLGWEDPLEKKMATNSSIPAWNPNGQRSLADYRQWGLEESDTTKRLHYLFKYICIFVHIEVQESHWNVHSGCLKIESNYFYFLSHSFIY